MTHRKLALACTGGVLALLGALASPSGARADTVTCSYTEPFLRTSYDTVRKQLTVLRDVPRRRQVIGRVVMHEVRPGLVEFRDAAGRTLQRIERTCRGSDGMSDQVFPFEGRFFDAQREVYGGCRSTRLQRC